MFDRPPPSTMTSGSSRLMTLAERARHAILVARQRRDRASASPAAARAAISARGRRRAAAARRSRAPAPGPRETSRCSRCGRSSTAGPATRRRARAGSGLCPHSPAIAFAPTSTLPIDDDAAAGAGADDHAEDDARAGRRAVGRLRQREAVGVVGEADRPLEQPRQILGERRPISHVEFAFLIRPVAGEIVPGNADADGAARAELALRSSRTRPATAVERLRVVAARRRDPPPQPLAPVVRDRDRLRSSCRRGRCRCACAL